MSLYRAGKNLFRFNTHGSASCCCMSLVWKPFTYIPSLKRILQVFNEFR